MSSTESETMRISAEGMDFGYNEDHLTLENVGISIAEGDIVGILGPNGSGKTTMIKCLNRILTPSQGTILLNGDDIRTLKRADVAKNIGYVPQTNGDLVSAPTVFEVVMMGRKPHMSWQTSEEDESLVWRIMEELDVAHLASKSFGELSSGQTQRVLMARAIAQEAKVFLLDEPTSNLDIKYQIEVMDMVSDIVKNKGGSACAIIHDLDLALRYCNKILLLKNGKVFDFGKSSDVLTSSNVKDVYNVDVVVEELLGRKRLIVI